MKRRTINTCLAIAVLASWGSIAYGQKNVLQPGDPISASSANSPGSEGVANAIDGTQAKYLNFDAGTGAGSKPTGFVVSPSVGVTWVTGISIQSANDAPERDPKNIVLEGSNDEAPTWSTGTWEGIYTNTAVPAFANRFETQTLTFENLKAFRHYRFTVVEVATANSCCMQVAEVQILGSTLPKNILQPSDPIAASSANSPGSEGVANAIDGTQAKYLNFDAGTGAGSKPVGFVVSPSVGATVVRGIVIQSANDAPERDPKNMVLEGSNDDAPTWSSGNWVGIYTNTAVPAFANRFQEQTFLFQNVTPYKHYRWTVVEVATPNSCCMQVAEVKFLGTGAPKNVLQPSDAIAASSSNSPGSEGVANAIDGTQAKYLNFDAGTGAGSKPVGFVVTPGVGATTVIGISMQSANDAPERDPKHIVLEGSNDDAATWSSGTWESIYVNNAVPAFANRFETQTFYFQNAKAFKHYRWTVVEVTTANSCCMQIAEVALLAVTDQTDCTKARFLTQPENTPVLNGSQATFFTAVNGPWPLQWFKNGQRIAGATGSSYTTEVVTPENATNVYEVEIVGCEKSSPVLAQIFTPSTTKSIGIQFGGGGANGAPVYMNVDDIAGVQLQAYWNTVTNNSANAGNTGDQNSMADTLIDSSNANSPITFSYETTGRWGAGTGTDSATGRMLNGTAGSGGANATDHFARFSNVPAGNHSVLVYVVSPPLQYQTVAYHVNNGPTNFVRVMNSDEYKPAPGFYRGTSTDPNKPSIANFIRFDNVQPEGGDVTLWFNVVAGSGQATGVGALQLLLNPPAVGEPPVVTTNPQPTVGPEGGTVRLTVAASGNNLTYQWRKSGRNLPNGGNISGATTSTLTIRDLSAADEGAYSVAVFNPAGSTISANATVFVSKYDIKDQLVGYWKLDQTSGASAANSVSGGQAIALTGAPAWGAGAVANGLTLDGSTYGVVANYPKSKVALSGSGWVNIPTAPGVDVDFFRNGAGNLRAPGDGSPAPSGQFEIGLDVADADGIARLYSRIQAGPNFPVATAPAAFPSGSWTHVGFTADGAQLRLYLNGQLVASDSYLDNLKEATVDFLSVGVRMDTNDVNAPIVFETSPNWFQGQMDEIAIWNRALTAEEMSKIFEAGKAGKALDTIVLTPPVSDEPEISAGIEGGKLTIRYTGTLQSSGTVETGYQDVAGATSPYQPATTAPAQFYRARK